MPGSRDKENSIISVAASSDFREVTFKCLVFTRQAIFTIFAFPQGFFFLFLLDHRRAGIETARSLWSVIVISTGVEALFRKKRLIVRCEILVSERCCKKARTFGVRLKGAVEVLSSLTGEEDLVMKINTFFIYFTFLSLPLTKSLWATYLSRPPWKSFL